MLGTDACADVEQRVFGDAEFDDPSFRLDLGLAERNALRLGEILRLRSACSKLVYPSRSISRRPMT
jgi:hypothetical protein